MEKEQSKETTNYTYRDNLISIEKEMQKKWETEKTYYTSHLPGWTDKMDFDLKNKNKYFATFPYPYMNGKLHLGHAFSMTKTEVMCRYQRKLGKNVLFPQGFHCTGMPIAAAANKVKREIEGEDLGGISQIKILKQLGVEESEIPKFSNPVHWVEYFPPLAMQDLKNIGMAIDWSRTFITTERHQYYDKFVEWNFLKLKQNNKIKFGKYPTVYSTLLKQPCADHDRSEGEGVNVQEYTLIKMQIIDNFPKSIQNFTSKKIFLVAATLRPETMYGQTNCFICPKGEYGLYEMKNGELFICSHSSARNMAYQDLTKTEFVAEPIVIVKGHELIGTKVHAPLSAYPNVFVLPMPTISMDKGTGVVTSVPSDSPDDYITYRECAEEQFRKTYPVITDEMVSFKPVPIINIPGYGDLPAQKLIEEKQINSCFDRLKLDEAKKVSYMKGFHEGVFLIEPYAGEKVFAVKPKVKDDLIRQGYALVYYEPEDKVVSRTGDLCVVAYIDQWLIDYGEESWRSMVKEYITNNFETYGSALKNGFQDAVDWLQEWGCSRTFGIGTKIPWDKQYLIESLSDSTIYMAFYTISNFLSQDLYGDKPSCGILPEDMTEEVFDYIFLGTDYPKNTKIQKELLETMRESFNYWYPMDLRCSGKDLIKNHLLMCLYNHAAIWKDKKLMPKSFYCNGHVQVNSEKMSKSNGNFYTVADLVSNYGADAARMALCDAGDTLDDSNFSTITAQTAIMKIYKFIQFFEKVIAKIQKDTTVLKNPIKHNSVYDKFLDSYINYYIKETRNAYESMRFKDVIKYGFHSMINMKDDYVYNVDEENWNIPLLFKLIETLCLIMNPVISHTTEFLYDKYLKRVYEKIGSNDKIFSSIYFALFPNYDNEIDTVTVKDYVYVKNLICKIKDHKNFKTKRTTSVIKLQCFDPRNENIQFIITKIQESSNDDIETFKKVLRTENVSPKIMQLAVHLFKEYKQSGEKRNLVIDEIRILSQYKDFIKVQLNCENLEFDYQNNSTEQKEIVFPGLPLVFIKL
jgi:leucyl-tRNA synthetase